MAPIDPDHLLKALDSLLSKDGGIKSTEDVPRLASLMKKFSKKLVSRCVYCNVLIATEPDILSEYLDKGGWDTINTWLEYAKSSTSPSFLIEMLKLCKILPMTLNRLKENNTAKLIKSLTKHENNDVKSLSSELVTKWMTIIKGKKSDPPVGEKKKKKGKQKPETENKEEESNAAAKPTTEMPKSPVKIKGVKRPSSEKEPKKEEYNEDVKIDPEPLMPVSKKPRADRPKTVKVFQKKFRATGLLEETPLPKKVNKKIPTIDKTAVAAAAKNALKLHAILPDRINEKKIKPESLVAINENSSTTKGIKIIPAKPRPTYMLHESASFMDALTSQPPVVTKRKKKATTNKLPNSPTSPTIAAPKLQFYKDTLEMNNESSEKEDNEKENVSTDKNVDSPQREEETSSEIKAEAEPMEVSTEDGGHTPPNNENENVSSPVEVDDFKGMEEERLATDPNQIRSILSHGRRKGKKKSVKWWWIVPILIDIPPALVEPGCQSKEKEIESLRQQTTLQEIYFTREMIPDSPHEPDLEIIPPQEPKIIPLDEDNVIGPLVDYSTYEPPKPAPLPEVLSSLIKINSNLPTSALSPNHNQEQMHMEIVGMKQPLLSSEKLNCENNVPVHIPYDPGEPLSNTPPNSLLGPGPRQNMYGMSSPPINEIHNTEPQSEWRTLDMVQDQYYPGYNNMNSANKHNLINDQIPGGPMNMRPRIMQENFRPMHKGPPRGMGPRPRNIHRVPCRHFVAGGCRFGMKCTFLHPGVNGPPIP
ncbi:hypothetical protein TNIN_465692 [Trichonephila inaurata madagascariensis]|uniref:Serine/threonine-protein phosphatase 1 regulatory subunit 10 n=1 Tax=Trichonephila inaurata madagascariensis TaxID=2747483 RepID=A0A8X6XT12_9ARAC|nr:hypothetical protein TNIN_465692 [Trichonephila inaurata madagascariensis]